ncbi:sialidase family protein [Lacipirellula sp.]|uniref:sialidase family protein n=1 Tax=Lacipirellula sp. TaxID=2691419 RepID=UPI003D102C7F
MLRQFDPTFALLAATCCLPLACFAPARLIAAEKKAATTAAEPYFHTQPLFEAGRDGYRCYRIPAIAVAPKGAVLAAAAGRFNGHGDWSNTDLMLRRSTDGGQTWDEQQVLVNDGVNTVDNPCFIVDAKNGEVHLMYQVAYQRAYLKTSRDDGATWSAPHEITAAFDEFRTRDGYEWQVIAMGPGHGITLKNGRLVVPVWLATDKRHRPSISTTVYSDDQGETWHAGDVIVATTDETPNPSETELVELSDGRVLANVRNESKRHRRLFATSADGATGWTKPEFQESLYEPICMGGNATLADDAGKTTALLYSYPNSGPGSGPTGKEGSRERRNLTVRLSDDDGKHWQTSRVVDVGPSGYSDMAVASDGTVYLLYEAESLEPKGPFIPAKLELVRFNRAWLEQQEPQSADAGK